MVPDDSLRPDTSDRSSSDERLSFLTDDRDPVVTSIEETTGPDDSAGDSSEAPGSDSPGQRGSEEPIAALTVQTDEGESRRVDMVHPRFLIGGETTDLPLDDPFVAPWHAQLYVDGQTLVLEDMGSDNGVFLRIADEFALEDRDEILVGRQRLVFRSGWPTEDAPEAGAPELGAPAAGSPYRILRYFEGGHLAGVYPVQRRISIGTNDTTIECPQDTKLSTRHAAIVREGESHFLRDLHSEFGTFIRIHGGVELVDGDCFMVGRTRIQVVFP